MCVIQFKEKTEDIEIEDRYWEEQHAESIFEDGGAGAKICRGAGEEETP